MRRIRQWFKEHPLNPLLVKRITYVLVVLAVLASLFFGLLWAYFFFGDDLILTVNTGQTSFNITNAERAPVHLTIETSGQLFCTAACELSLLNVSTKAQGYQEQFLISRGQRVERDFSLAPGSAGTGQVLYSVTASCRNIPSTFCPTAAPERRKTLLFFVNYGLASEEAAVKAALRPQLEQMLSLLQQTDLALAEVQAIIAENPRLNAGSLLTRSANVQDQFYTDKRFLENAEYLWTQESYTVLYYLMQNSSTNPAQMNETLQRAKELKGGLQQLAATHNQARNDLVATRGAIADAQGYSVVPGSAELLNPLISQANMLTLLYGGNVVDYPILRANVSSLKAKTTGATALLGAQNVSYVMLGRALVSAHQADLCARNITCQASYPGDMPGVCAELARLSTLADNSSLANASDNTSANESDTKDKAKYPDASEGNFSVFGLNQTILNSTRQFLTNCNTTATLLVLNISPLEPLQLRMPQNITSAIKTSLADNLPQCCVFGSCQPCCNTAACSDDPTTYPVVFVHGHSFNALTSPEYSLGGYFARIQHRLQEDGYLDAGIITPSSTFADVGPGEWGISGRPVTVRVTYYYNFYRDGDDYELITQKSENIETYAIRLKEMIDITKHHTGKSKVTVVTHSMGGLVTRRYIQMFGEDSIDKVIMIATPNHGVRARTETLCPIFGESKECADMEENSVFMRKVNDARAQPSHVQFITVTGRGCDTSGQDGDGVVAASSVPLQGAKNYDVNGSCEDFFGTDLHTEMLNIDQYPEVYDIIRDAMQS